MEHSLLRMMERHAALDALFLAHQTALLDRDRARAVETLAAYRAALEAHVREEEERILPLYAERAPQPAGGGTSMFLDEHRKIRQLAGELDAATAALPPAPEPKQLLAVLDREATFKNLMDHHDRRERAFLYPGLDAVTTPAERAALLASLGLASG